MKKFFLFAAAVVCAAVANAQVVQLDAEALGLGSDAVVVPAGQVWATTEIGTLSNAFETGHKAVDAKNNNYNKVVFDGQYEVVTKGGLQGQDNPKDADGANPGISLAAPIQGAVIKFNAEKDGYVCIVAKISSNKNYYVFEEGSPIGFGLSMEVEAGDLLPQLLTYVAEGEGEYNNITDAGWCDWPENVYYKKILGQEKPSDIKKNGLGVIGFKCYAGCEYLIGAGGSKITWCGAYISETAPKSCVLKGDDPENPVADFNLSTDEDTPVTPEPAFTESTSLKVTCPEGKANAWDSQIFINFPTVLEAGKKYTITMSVKGSVALEPKQGTYGPEAIQPVAQDNNSANKDQWGGPADLQYLNHFAVTTEWVPFVNDCEGNAITTDGTFPYSRLLLNLGNYAGDLYIDNVRAIDEAGVEVFCIGFETAAEQALVENGWMNLTKEFVGGATAINKVEAVAADGISYNVMGQKAAKGLIIRNGQVIMVK